MTIVPRRRIVGHPVDIILGKPSDRCWEAPTSSLICELTKIGVTTGKHLSFRCMDCQNPKSKGLPTATSMGPYLLLKDLEYGSLFLGGLQWCSTAFLRIPNWGAVRYLPCTNERGAASKLLSGSSNMRNSLSQSRSLNFAKSESLPRP